MSADPPAGDGTYRPDAPIVELPESSAVLSPKQAQQVIEQLARTTAGLETLVVLLRKFLADQAAARPR